MATAVSDSHNFVRPESRGPVRIDKPIESAQLKSDPEIKDMFERARALSSEKITSSTDQRVFEKLLSVLKTGEHSEMTLGQVLKALNERYKNNIGSDETSKSIQQALAVYYLIATQKSIVNEMTFEKLAKSTTSLASLRVLLRKES